MNPESIWRIGLTGEKQMGDKGIKQAVWPFKSREEKDKLQKMREEYLGHPKVTPPETKEQYEKRMNKLRPQVGEPKHVRPDTSKEHEQRMKMLREQVGAGQGVTVLRKYASGYWNSPVLPGQMFESKEALFKEAKRAKKPLSEVKHPFTECMERIEGRADITDHKKWCGKAKHEIEKGKGKE